MKLFPLMCTQGDMLNVMCGFDTTNKPQSDVEDRIYTRGCLMGFGQWLETNTIIIGAVCLGVMVPQVGRALIFFICLSIHCLFVDSLIKWFTNIANSDDRMQ